jgi:hypothetical protein
MIEKRNEVGDGPLKIDVVLPERVIGIDEECLGTVGVGLMRHHLI